MSERIPPAGAGTLVRLFFEMFRIALFVAGGGFAIIAVCDEFFSRKLKWTREGELVDMLPVYQMMPGILAAHNAVYIGRKVAGLRGSVIALAGVALPSIVIFTFVSMGYDFIPLENPIISSAFVGLRAALSGVIGAMMFRTWRKNVLGLRGLIVFAVAFALIAFDLVSAVFVIVAALVCGIVSGLTPRFRKVFQSSPLAALLFLQYGAVAFGGGYTLVPIYIRDFVGEAAKYLQIAPDEFANLMALTQITPGPIGINAATFFGYRLFGVIGGLVATSCIILPGFIAMTFVLRSLEKCRASVLAKSVAEWMRPVTTALMASAFVSFLGMCVWDASGTNHSSWCTFGAVGMNISAAVLVIAAIFAVFTKRLSVMSVIFISTLIAAIARI